MVANMKRAMVGTIGALVLGFVCLGAATAPAQAATVSVSVQQA